MRAETEESLRPSVNHENGTEAEASAEESLRGHYVLV